MTNNFIDILQCPIYSLDIFNSTEYRININLEQYFR